jgi:ribosomal protein S26
LIAAETLALHSWFFVARTYAKRQLCVYMGALCSIIKVCSD